MTLVDFNRRKKKIYAWTVDDIDSMQKILSEHVDAVVTSNPTLLQNLMQDIRIKCFEEGFRFSQIHTRMGSITGLPWL